jgi:hypothetical protein
VSERLDQLESENAIRSLVATYFDYCDRLHELASLDEFAALFTEDAVWTGKGTRYTSALGTHHGRIAIIAMLGHYRGPPPHFALNAHFLCSEKVCVHGEHAHGRWLMLQTSSYTAGGADLRAARLNLEFERVNECWRIKRFETENLFSRPVDRWDDPAPVPTPERGNHLA